jgi:di- and tripeptidase
METSHALDDNPIVERSRKLPLQDSISRKACSPTPQIFATDNDSELADDLTPTLIHRWHHDYSILSTAAFPQRGLLFCGTQDHLILVFDIATYERKFVLKGHTGSVLCLTKSEDEKVLFSGGSDSLVKVWDVESMKETHTIYSLVDIGDIFSLVWSQKFNTVFYGCQNASILFVHLLDTEPKDDPSYLPSHRFDKFFDSRGPTGDINSSKKRVEIESRLIEVPSSNILRYAHHGFIYTMKVQGDFLITGSGDGLIKIWDMTKSMKLVTELDNEDSVLSIALNDSFLYCGLPDGKIKLWDLNTSQQLLAFNSDVTTSENDNDVLTLAATKNYLFKGSQDGITKWKFGTDIKHFWHAHDGLVLSSEIVTKGHKVLLITGGNDASLAIWDITFDHEVNHRRRSSTSLNFQLDNDSLLSTLSDLVAFKTVSKKPESYIDDSRRCASYLKSLIKKFGGESDLIPVADGNPIVYATFKSVNPDAPKVLWYGHYDIIDANDQSGWNFDPFKLTANDGYLYARGVSDNKGPTLAAIYAVAELYQARELSCDVVFLIEGEEECGSFGFEETITKHSKIIGDIDWILLSNSYWLDEKTPCLNYGLRGVISASVSISSDKPDRHSGVDGGASGEPTIELIRLLSNLIDDDGKVTIPNFYEPILPLTITEEKLYDDIIKRIPNDDNIKRGTLLAKWKFPSLTIHKIDVSGPRNNTVIPKSCTASVSIRIVPEQDIDEIKESFLNYLTNGFKKFKSENHLQIKFIHEADAWIGDPSSAVYQILNKEVQEEWGVKPLYIREGGSIPSVRFLEKVFSAQAAQIPCGQSTDNAHLNNEKLRVKNLYKLRNILKRTFQQLPKTQG